MHVALLSNPTARAGARTQAGERAADRLRSRGIRTTVISGGSAAESTDLLRTAIAQGADAVLVAGGDGTVGLALQELAGTGIPLGIIPVGTGNDMATTVGLAELDVERAADAVADGVTRTVDLARVTRADGSVRYYGTVLASGFDSRVNDRANAMRWPRGGSRYTLAILRELMRVRSDRFDVVLRAMDGSETQVTGELLMATVGNGPTYGGGIPICPDADPCDGELDVTLVRPAGLLRLLRLLPRLYRGTHTTAAEVSTYRVSSVTLDAPGVTAYADGDPIGVLPVTIDIAPAALTIFAPS